MAQATTFDRLLLLRRREEELHSQEMTECYGEQRAIEAAIRLSADRVTRAYRLIAASARSGDLTDRVAALAALEIERRAAPALSLRLAAASQAVELARISLKAKRVEVKQVETLLADKGIERARTAARRDQQAMDEWYRVEHYPPEGKRQSYAANYAV